MSSKTKTQPALRVPYWQRIIDQQTYPVIVVLHEKHGPAYHLALDKEQLLRVYLAVLKARATGDYAYITEPEPGGPDGIRDGELPQGKIDELPEPYKSQALKIKQWNDRQRAEHAEEVAEWADVQKALADKDGYLAFKVLHARNDHEYERIEMVNPQEIE